MTTWNTNSMNMISGFKAAVDLSTKQFHYVKVSAAGVVNIAGGAAGEIGIGVLMNKPAAGINAEIAGVGNGSVPVKLEGTASVMTRLMSNANGKGIPSTAAADIISWIALEAGVTGDIIAAVPVLYVRHAT
jgi:hypothetical protein